jgi:tetratricopeptide (TPR) repeat protein
LVDENGATAPATHVEVTVKETGDSDVADGKGLFHITLPQAFGLGREITIAVDKQGWAIWEPLEGKTPVPQGLLTIRLLPRGSKKFWTDKFIQTFIEDTVSKAKLEIKLADQQEKPKPVDFGPMVKNWASKYGFSAEEAKQQVDKWIAEVQAVQEDFYKLGLAAFAGKNFHKAGELFIEAGQNSEKQLAAVEKQSAELNMSRIRLVQETVRNYLKAGDSRYSDYAFDEALTGYQKALSFVQQDLKPELWADVQVDIGRATSAIGARTEGPAVQQYLMQAVMAYRAALDVYTREQLPQDWAATQNNLGAVLQEQGTRTGGEEGQQLLAQAVTAYHAALEVYTHEQLPQDWARTQNNLGNVLREQGTRRGGDEGRQLLAQAVTAYRAAMEVRTRGQFPQDWAGTQNNLGAVLQEQGTRTSGEEGRQLLAQAVTAYRAALEVYTREQLPQQWAMTQNNLGAVLQEQGPRTSGEEGRPLLAQAVTAYRAALEVYTREQLPQQWAMTQNNLGAVLQEQGTRTGGEEGRQLLAQAVTAYHAALEVRTRTQLPQQWARTQNNLGAVLQEQGTRTGGEKGQQLLAQAVTAYRTALEAYTPDQLPQEWAMTQYNLAKTQMALAQWANAEQSLRNVLRVDPNSEETYLTLCELYHSRLFDFQAAFDLDQVWLEQHPGDLLARANAAEAAFTIGHFGDAEARLAETLGSSELRASSRVALHGLEVASILLRGKTEMISKELQELLDLVSAQPTDFRVEWDWAGTVHFIQTDDRLASVRDWLLSFLEALQGKDRAAVLEGLRTAASSFAARRKRDRFRQPLALAPVGSSVTRSAPG